MDFAASRPELAASCPVVPVAGSFQDGVRSGRASRSNKRAKFIFGWMSGEAFSLHYLVRASDGRGGAESFDASPAALVPMKKETRRTICLL
jgi:hypothetical protein